MNIEPDGRLGAVIRIVDPVPALAMQPARLDAADAALGFGINTSVGWQTRS